VACGGCHSATSPTVAPWRDAPRSAEHCKYNSFTISSAAAARLVQGGFAVAYLGASACFLIDAATFLVAAACATQLVAAAAKQGCVPTPD
jgi:hypothetical protein